MLAISLARTFFGMTESALARLGLVFELARATMSLGRWNEECSATLERFNLIALVKARKGLSKGSRVESAGLIVDCVQLKAFESCVTSSSEYLDSRLCAFFRYGEDSLTLHDRFRRAPPGGAGGQHSARARAARW